MIDPRHRTKDAEAGEGTNAEAGDYIEDDPRAWEAWMHAVRRYAPDYSDLVAHLGDTEAAVSVIAGSMLAYLADVHDVYLLRAHPELPTLDVGRLAVAIENHSHFGVASEVVIACGRGRPEGCASAIVRLYDDLDGTHR